MSILHDINEYAPRFFSKTKDMPYIPRGVFFSELLAFAALADKAGVHHIIESGTGEGHSSSVLSRLFEQVMTLDNEDKSGLSLPENVTKIYGDAMHNLFPLVASTSHNVAVLIDGPKHKRAVELAQELMHLRNVRLIGIHDVQRGSEGRAAMQEAFQKAFYTDDRVYVEAYGHADEKCLARASSVGKTFPDHGPTMGIIL